MIKVIENLSDSDYKKEVLSCTEQSQELLNKLKVSIEESDGLINLDEVVPKIHNIYDDIMYLYLWYETNCRCDG